MTTSTNRGWAIPQRPVRGCITAFAIMSALFVVATPFIPDVPHLPFLLSGIAYSAFLAVIGVGFALLGPRIGRPLLFSTMAVTVCLMLAMYLPLLFLRERGMRVLDWVLPVAQPVIWLAGIAFIAASVYGWVRHYRRASVMQHLSIRCSQRAQARVADPYR